MALRHEYDCGPPRKRAFAVLEPAPTSLSPPSATTAPSTGWEWSPASFSSFCGRYFDVAARTVNSPSSGDSSDSSGSLSASHPTSDSSAMPLAIPSTVATFGSSCRTPALSLAPNGVLQAPNVMKYDSRQTFIRPSVFAVEQEDGRGSTNEPYSNCTPVNGAGAVTPWHIHDFGEGLVLDGSLGGLSDLSGSINANDLMEFVRRQSSHPNGVNGDCLFQYVLMAPTAAAIRLSEEPQTYLNQGQSYEIKCKKLGDATVSPDRLVKSVIRISFHDRRQRFQERQLLQQWKNMHSDEKMAEPDIPLSYNVRNVKADALGTVVEFLWDPTKNASVFLKLNCVSTEFTVRKHGGERGVPFRLQVDTYRYGDGTGQGKLASSYAQIKVFKTKGADRKNKTDRDKLEKRAGRDKYQPAFDYTVLSEICPADTDELDKQQPMDVDMECPPKPVLSATIAAVETPCESVEQIATELPNGKSTSQTSVCSNDSGLSGSVGSIAPLSPGHDENDELGTLQTDASPEETVHWLRFNRFSSYLKVFSSFSGADLHRLSREDLIQICGTANGIRLFNALQYKKQHPRLTLYMRVPGALAFHATYMVTVTLRELVRKVCNLVQVKPSQVCDVYCQGPDGINVHVNDEVVQNMPDRSRYVIDAMKCGDEQSERYRILLKATAE